MIKISKMLLLGLTVLFSTACGNKNIHYYQIDCPRPNKPILPLLMEDKRLEHPENIEILLYRDDVMRIYIESLDNSLSCYESFNQKEDFL